MAKSNFGTINKKDLYNSIYYFIGTFLLSLAGVITLGKAPETQQLLQMTGTALTPAILCIFKGIATNSDGKVFIKEIKN